MHWADNIKDLYLPADLNDWPSHVSISSSVKPWKIWNNVYIPKETEQMYSSVYFYQGARVSLSFSSLP